VIAILLVVTLAQVPRTCDGCHPAEGAAHADTRHAHAWDAPAFQQAWSATRDRWCLTCHAPPDGVRCASCHVRDGFVRTADVPTEAAHAAHPMMVADLGVGACVSCHQFRAPGGGGVVQDTVAEHARSGVTATCASCHLVGHGLRGPRDRAFVKAAVSARYADGVVRLVAAGVGHAVPTGDPWRRFEIELLAGDDVVRRYVVGRRVAGVGADFREVVDHRLPPPGPDGTTAREVRVDPTGADRWRVVFALTDPAHPGDDPAWTLAEGSL
jgi:hypothetical protein